MKVAVVGAGAAGFFSAIQIKYNYPEASVVLLEKTSKILSKVKISGGGRCNVTNEETDIDQLAAAYPRGGRFMKRALYSFSTHDIWAWFESKGVELYAQDDGRVFPKSDRSASIINCLTSEATALGIVLLLNHNVKQIRPMQSGIKLSFQSDELADEDYDYVVVTTGGHPSPSGFKWLEELGHKIEPPVPSLFTFNMPDEPIKELMGVAVPVGTVSVVGSKLSATGPILITHWGMSGPAILKLSAFGARELSKKKYDFSIIVNWINERNDEDVRAALNKAMQLKSKQSIFLANPFRLPKRLWRFLLEKIEIIPDKPCGELGKKQKNKIVHILTNDEYGVKGKTTFKEEFVTCGGVSLKSIHQDTMQSKLCHGLYFAGEVLDIDGITGGFNFQAAWTTAFLAGQLKG